MLWIEFAGRSRGMHHFVAGHTMVRMPAMKTIAKTGKLQLNKETLRSLSNEQLEGVAGATGAFCAPSVLCTIGCPTTVVEPPGVSMPNPAMCPGVFTVIKNLDPLP
jgi:hypothetical protein